MLEDETAALVWFTVEFPRVSEEAELTVVVATAADGAEISFFLSRFLDTDSDI